MKDLSCFDCALYQSAYGTRCSRHRTPEETAALDEQMSRRARAMSDLLPPHRKAKR